MCLISTRKGGRKIESKRERKRERDIEGEFVLSVHKQIESSNLVKYNI